MKEKSDKEIISEKLINVKKFDYKDVKGDLKKHFDDFMKNPADFGVEDKKVIEDLQKMGGISKHFMWKEFKKQVELKMNDLAHDEAASAFILDFEQDEDHQLTTIKQLKKIIKDPSNKEYDLEDDMIKYLKSRNFDEKVFIEHVIKLDSDLEKKESKFKDFGLDMLKYLKGIWLKVAPVIDKILDQLVDLGSGALKTVLDTHLDGNQKKIVDTAIDELGKTINKIDDKITEIVKTENEDDLITAIKENSKELVEDIVENATVIGTEAITIGTNLLNLKKDEEETVEVTGEAKEETIDA
jgi:hypothetical protein